jgi:hypothetical protein
MKRDKLTGAMGSGGGKGRAPDDDAPGADGRSINQGDEGAMPGGTDWFRKARTLVERAPDARAELVIGIKADIARGGYRVDAWKVAEKMIERAIRNVLRAGE